VEEDQYLLLASLCTEIEFIMRRPWLLLFPSYRVKLRNLRHEVSDFGLEEDRLSKLLKHVNKWIMLVGIDGQNGLSFGLDLTERRKEHLTFTLTMDYNAFKELLGKGRIIGFREGNIAIEELK